MTYKYPACSYSREVISYLRKAGSPNNLTRDKKNFDREGFGNEISQDVFCHVITWSLTCPLESTPQP